MWFCSSPFRIAHHSAKSSRVVISGCGFVITRLIGALVRGILSSRRCFPVFAFISRHWNTCIWSFVRKLCKAAPWRFDCRFACWRSIIAFPGNSELTVERLPSWRISSEKWFRRCIFTMLKSNLLTRCCAISDSICVFSSLMPPRFSAAERLFQEGSLSSSSCLSKVSYFVKVSETFFVDSLAQNRMKTSLRQWNSSR